MASIFDQIMFVRWVKGGDWVKTTHRGWITLDTYSEYLSYGFDPIGLEYKSY